MVEEMECAMLKDSVSDIANKKMKKSLSHMTRAECIQDECEHYASCWNNKPNNIEIAD